MNIFIMNSSPLSRDINIMIQTQNIEKCNWNPSALTAQIGVEKNIFWLSFFVILWSNWNFVSLERHHKRRKYYCFHKSKAEKSHINNIPSEYVKSFWLLIWNIFSSTRYRKKIDSTAMHCYLCLVSCIYAINILKNKWMFQI